MSLLEMEQITKNFPGVIANDKVDFTLKSGEIHALVGENGAGKTTLMKILYGLYKPDSGIISIKGKNIQIKNPKDAISQGIGMVHQHFMLIPPFTALENIILGDETHAFGVLKNDLPAKKITSLMDENQLVVELDEKIEDLAVGIQQRVEILKILYRGAEILVFDEPTAVLTPQEVDELFKTFRSMKANRKGLIFISHKLDEVLDIADTITVIRRGQIVKTLPKEEATKPLIAELMVGKPVLLKVDNPEQKAGDMVLQFQNIKLVDDKKIPVLNNIDFNIHAGEIYGIAGVEGNGQTEIIQCISEKTKIIEGDILLKNESIVNLEVRERREKGIGHIPADRHKYGLLLPYSIADNISLGRHHKEPFVKQFQMVNTAAIKEYARELIEQYDIRTPSENLPANALSGGNQQKVIVAREMSCDPVLLLANQPTRGVDIGATEFIYKQLVKAKLNGKAVLLISADLDEILSLSDRIGVLFKGKIIKEFHRSEATKEEVGFYMMGEKKDG